MPRSTSGANPSGSLHALFRPRRKTARGIALLAAAAAIDCASQARAQTQSSTWTGATNVNWNNAANWSPNNAYPNDGNDGIGDFTVTIPSVSAEPTLNVSAVIDGLTLNSGATLKILGGDNLTLAGLTFTDNGSITINSNDVSGSTLTLEVSTISGTGTLTLNGAGANASVFGDFTQAAGHTINGFGQVNGEFTNNGTVNANLSGQTLNASEELFNNGVLEATNNGTLLLTANTIIQQSGGQIIAAGGTVSISESQSIEGGTLSSSSGGVIVATSGTDVTLSGVTNNATLDIASSATIDVTSDLTDNGIINVNSNKASGNTAIEFQSGTLSGTGTINLMGGAAEASVVGSVTQSSGHTIAGNGTISAAISNAGNIDANVAGGTLTVSSSSVTNTGTMQASAGTLVFSASEIIINTGGTIAASGGTVLLTPNLTVGGGTFSSSGSGLLIVQGATLDGFTVSTGSVLNVQGGDNLTLDGGPDIDNGKITVNYDNETGTSSLVVMDTTTLSGSGSLTFNLAGGGSTLITNGALTVSASMTSGGPGILTKQGQGTLILSASDSFAIGTGLSVAQGTLQVATGGSVTANGSAQEVGYGFSDNGTLTVQGTGMFSTDDALIIGGLGGLGTLIVQDTAKLNASILYIGEAASSSFAVGTVAQSGGQISATDVVLATGSSGASAAYNLDGGTLSTASVDGGIGSSTMNFSGGTLQATGSNLNFVSGITHLLVQNAGAIIDSNGQNISIAEPLVAGSGSTGGLTKIGAGTLSLTATNTYTGSTNVNAGTLKIVGQSLPSSIANIATGAIVEYNDTPAQVGQALITYQGTGTLRKTGLGGLVFGAGGAVNVNLSTGALVDVEQGELFGSSSYNGDWDNNLASLNVASGATFDAVEGGQNSKIQVDALTGGGIVQGGYYLNGPTTLIVGAAGGSGTFSGSLRDDANTQLAILKMGSGTETLSGASTYTGQTTVNGGKLIIGAALALGDGPVAVNANSKLQFATGIGGPVITLLSIASNGSLDLQNNDLFIAYGGSADPINSIRTYLQSGYGDGAWNGAGINSTLAQTNPAYGIGYADSADPNNPAGLASNTIEIKYTLLGDANLDGAVNGSGFAIVASNFNKADLAGHSGWDEGDFNYDGSVNGSDFAALAANFNKGASQADVSALDTFAGANGLLADVPEPGSFGVVVMASGAMLARHHRQGLRVSNRTE